MNNSAECGVERGVRLDVYLVENGLSRSRERAKEAVKSGFVTVNGEVVSKPSLDVARGDEVACTGEKARYVGRGGDKLERAFDVFGVDARGRVCLDVGASTGGFTDCLLQRGAAFVYAADAGSGQLDGRLANDGRVKSMERTDIRGVKPSDFILPPELITVDVSFISLKYILPKVKELLPVNGEAVVLIKPQFEAGREYIGKNGIVKDIRVHKRVLHEFFRFCADTGFEVRGLIFSPITGGSGNVEYLAQLTVNNISGGA